MRANVLVVETAETWLLIEDVPSGEEGIEAYLSLSALSDDEATTEATAELAKIRDGQTQITVGIDPTGDGDVPFVDWGPGDLCDVDGADRRCVSITFARDSQRDGRLVFVPQFGDIIDHPALLQQKVSRRMTPGSLGGVSRIAHPSQPGVRPAADPTVGTPIVVLTQAQYDALDPGPLDGVIYSIVG